MGQTHKTNIVAEFLKAQFTSVTATVIDFMLTAVLFQFAGVNHVLSTFTGSVAGGVVNCVLNYRWTFQGDRPSKKWVALKYSMVWIGSILLNTYGTAIGVKLFSDAGRVELSTVMSVKVVVAILVAVFWNFAMQKYFVYKKLKR